jgi:large conductance mechanosensitive channel
MQRNVQRVTSSSWLTEFRDFLMRGNIVDLAVAVVIGIAFQAVVTSLVDDIIMPIIGIFGGNPDFSSNTFTINGSVFGWGEFVTQLISFLIIAVVVFFVVVKPMNAMVRRMNRGEVPADPTTRACPECLSMVPTGAGRCMYCTQPLPPVATAAAD